jgi:Fe-S-cluster containining protein
MLIPDDVPRIARHLGYTDVMEFSRENLLASPGAIVLRDNQQVRIPTLVPQRGADGACKFLQNDLCTIHSVSPYGCAFFSEHEARQWVIKINSRSHSHHSRSPKPAAATHVSGPCLTPRI